MDGKYMAINIMVHMMPEELLIEKAEEAIKIYKLTGGEPPKAELMALITKWATAGMSMEEILAMAEKAEQVYKVGSRIVDGDEAQSN